LELHGKPADVAFGAPVAIVVLALLLPEPDRVDAETERIRAKQAIVDAAAQP
jgi:hypothetical protein